MHDIRFIRENATAFDKALGRRSLGDDRAKFSSANILKLDGEVRAAKTAFEQAQARRNAASKEVGDAKKAKDEARANALMAEVNELKDRLGALDAAAKEAEQKLDGLLATIPNLPFDDVPEGADEHGNKQQHIFGAPKAFSFKTRPHYDLGEGLKQMDFETAAKISGARFTVLKSGLARMERALAQFMLDVHTTEHGYTEVSPPLLVKDDAMFGTAQLPKFHDDQFATYPEPDLRANFIKDLNTHRDIILDHADQFGTASARNYAMQEVRLHDDPSRYWLIPTAEVSLTNLVRESILDEKELPLRLTAGTHCFRAEAGAAGRDTRGMIRQHQFFKVELVSVTTPETSRDEHERMLSCAEEVLRRLGLHYRVMTLCTGDMGFSSQKTYDIEVWMPGQGEGGMFREISSCSVCGDFQARRMNARVRGADGKPRFVHTLNGSGVAVGRALIAVMETYQQENGSIAVPDVLQPYMGGMKVIEKV